MKAMYPVIILCLIFTGCTRKTPDSPEAMAKKAAEVIIHHDKDEFEKIIVTRDDALSLFATALKHVKSDEKYKSQIALLEKEVETLKSNTNVILKKKRTAITASFKDLLDKAKAEGVDLSKARFKSVTKINTKTRMNLKQHDIYFLLTLNGNDYKIKLDDVMESPRGFILMDRIRWYGKQ